MFLGKAVYYSYSLCVCRLVTFKSHWVSCRIKDFAFISLTATSTFYLKCISQMMSIDGDPGITTLYLGSISSISWVPFS